MPEGWRGGHRKAHKILQSRRLIHEKLNEFFVPSLLRSTFMSSECEFRKDVEN